METLVVIAIIIGAGMLGATALLFALRHSRLYRLRVFARAAWLVIILWSSLTIVSSLLPLDYWHTPPFRKMIRIPRDAAIVSCYKLVLGKTEPFGNPWAKGQSVFGSSWFSRRGFAALFGKTVGDTDPELNALASRRDGIDAICVYSASNAQRAIILERSGGGSSGDHFLTVRLFEKKDNLWSELEHEEHNRSSLDDLFTRFSMSAHFGLAFLAVFVTVLLLCRSVAQSLPNYRAPLRFVAAMLPTYVLCVFTVAVVVWAVVPNLLHDGLAGIPSMFFLIPGGCVALAYIAYRVVLWREGVFCSNKEMQATN